jgi:hypothetical protein
MGCTSSNNSCCTPKPGNDCCKCDGSCAPGCGPACCSPTCCAPTCCGPSCCGPCCLPRCFPSCGYSSAGNKRKRISKHIDRVLKSSLFASIVMPDDWNDFITMTTFEKYRSMHSSAKHPIDIRYATFLMPLEGEIVVSISSALSTENDNKSSTPVPIKTYSVGQIIHLFPAGDYKLVCEPNCIIYGKYKLHFHARAIRRRSQVAVMDGRSLGAFLESHSHLYILNLLANINLPTLCADCYDLKGLSQDQVNVLGPLLDLESCLMGDIIIRSMSAVQFADQQPKSMGPCKY